jgi:DNA-binding transcriptional MerR regulator
MKLRLMREPHYPATISDAARLLGVSKASLLLYEKAGVVRPSRDSQGRRLYLPDDVQRVREYREQHGRK